jgi:hypothetical protein
MKPEIERAMREVLEAWETPDSIADLNKPKIGRPRRAKA